ncbi:putative glycerophosphodiester phosphodiesterase, protein kinase RLK-Pelle-LRK10L-2 family [Helianthus annuus]|nr:putative glycerophosphodiester phosphodiesterase, protein kinase RLK-Pelle-LRK10L-2 family [Helianthus annuus]KAJ0634886.1 putative glycerophosphodiester phosphodiesterase, protein kinase RLK-Pelle-LRK10L-2 family [Helianthus annuus]KAJ0824582.1 putative glycerophosphodiester phosphodiesterase, protein kinase RLK-Pelle-LRK10L-2 family [Helianthus annuus]
MYQYIPLNIFTWVLLFPLILSLPAVSSDARATPAGNLTCGHARAATNTFIPAFIQAMESLSTYLGGSNRNFAVTNFTPSSSPPFYVLVQCHQDLSIKDCLVCYAASRTAVPGCLPRTSGRIFLDRCFVRYDNYSFFQEAIDPATDATNCNSSLPEGGSFDFNRSVVDLVGNVIQRAVRYGGFGSMDLKGVYGLAQCWDSLSNEECSLCLNKATSEAISCLPSAEGRVMNAGCFLRYSTENFINNYSQAVPNNTSQSDMGRSGIGVGALLLTVVLLCTICYIKKFSLITYIATFKYKNEDDKNVEDFIKQYGSLTTKRYRYSDIKKITNSFHVELGSGGFGTVYLGKLSDGRHVAVKVLNSSKASGKEFINEVASIGRISHINIVSLLGFCSDNHKRALVYEFMPNGSLDKFIHHDRYSQKSSKQLEVMKLYEVALGIARGLDYLHRGCNPRILHLDIKPHNILLDDKFCPKIADFGLAKLYSRDKSIVSMLEARGTIGYIAPEVFYRNIGGVSHKSDVYSYGMLILEMVGGNKKVDVEVGSNSTSDSYFPYWIYNRLKKDEYVLDGVTSVEENEHAKKMTIVGLWCIQTVPTQRPSIAEVIDMLEGSVGALEVPQKPSFSSAFEAPVYIGSTSQSEQESSGYQHSYEL